MFGNPGTGKTTLLREVFEDIALGGEPNSNNVMVLLPDRRRAERFEESLEPRFLESAQLPGGHRRVRAVNSYAYLILSQWLLERNEPRPRPKLTGGADEDVWIAHWMGENPDTWKPLFPADAAQSESMRMGIRNALARVGERGIVPSELAEIADRSNIPEWKFLAELYADYAGGDTRALTSDSPRIDSARLQVIAAGLLLEWNNNAQDQGVTARLPVPRTILVDDLQDCTPATLQLLVAAHKQGAQIVACTSPTTVTAAFRGATGELGQTLSRLLSVDYVTLQEQHRSVPAITNIVDAASSWLGQQAPINPTPIGRRGGVWPAILTGSGRRGAWLAQKVRWNAYLNDVPWQSQAVIVRSAADIEPIRRQLLRADVPLAAGERPLQFAQNPTTATLLELLVPSEDRGLEEPAMRLLQSPFIGVDRLELYRFLRRHGKEQLDYESQIQAWLENPPGPSDSTDSSAERRLLKKLRRASAMWKARDAASKKSPQMGLWDLWDASAVEERWTTQALRGQASGEAADARLDAVLALFRRADFWEQQAVAESREFTTAKDFATETLEQVVAADSVAEVGLRAQGVEVLTVSQAAGQEWDAVYIIGLQDGGWPARPRLSSLIHLPLLEQILGSGEIKSDKDGRVTWSDGGDPETFRTGFDAREYRLRKRQEEARLLVSAMSRARTELHLVAIETDEEAASPFLNYLARQGALPEFRDAEGEAVPVEVPPPLDINSMIGQLRQITVSAEVPERTQKQAAALLAIMAKSGVEAANPSGWAGQGGITTDNPVVQGEKLRLGPSSLQTAKDCALQWFFRAIHGDDTEGILQPASISALQIGQLVHSVAEQLPHGDTEELRAELARQWETLGLDDTKWWVRRYREELDDMMFIMGQHFQSAKGRVEVEVPIRAELDNVIVSGRIDRVEELPDGTVQIIDIKTSKSLPAHKTMDENLQLGAYQLALGGSETVSRAALLGVRQTNYKSSLRIQPALDEEQSAALANDLEELGQTMVGPQYTPTVSYACDRCPFQAVCPAREKGTRSVP